MELSAMAGAVPAAFVASVIYSHLLRALPLSDRTKRILLTASLCVLAALLLEWTLLATIGTLESRALFGAPFELIHFAIFLLAVPALVNVLVFARPGTVLSWWFVVGLLGALLAFPVVLTQYGVSEALYGIDGQGGHYGRP
jgi:hypothetical protein